MTRRCRASLALLLLPVAVSCSALQRAGDRWWEGRRDASGQAPDPGLELPPTAIGKDFLPGGALLAATPGRGVQVSVFGLAGVLAGWDEGLEVNVLGLTFGVDITQPALKLPLVGRLGRP